MRPTGMWTRRSTSLSDESRSRLPRKPTTSEVARTILGLSRDYLGSISGVSRDYTSEAARVLRPERCVNRAYVGREPALKEARVSKMSDVAIRHFRNVSRGLVMVRPCGTGVRNCNQRPSYKDLGTGKLGIRAAKRGRAESCWCGVNLVFPLASPSSVFLHTPAPPSAPP
jgi:hypothetical protein